MTRSNRTADDSSPIIELRNVSKAFSEGDSLLDRLWGGDRARRAVCDVSLAVHSGETVGIVGESGCGKSTLAKILTGQLTPDRGQVRLNGTRVGGISERSTGQRRRTGVVFQHARGSFDPRWTVGRSLSEAGTSDEMESVVATGMDDADELLRSVDLDPSIADRYPRALSGGQIQRVALARALAHDPEVIILDEPVSGLDVATQATVLDLLADVQRRFDVGYLFVSHDLAVVRYLADRVAVMYAGEIVEAGTPDDLFQHPDHPYTEALTRAIPSDDPKDSPPTPLDGDPPDPADRPTGCPFHPRCPAATAECTEHHPEFETVERTRVRCLHAPEATGDEQSRKTNASARVTENDD